MQQRNGLATLSIALSCIGIVGLYSACKGRSDNTLKSATTVADYHKSSSYFMQAQGMTPQQRDLWYWTGQGSQVIPYNMFLHLEQASSTDLFRDPQNMRRLGYIPEYVSASNPDGLPIGFVKEKIKRDNSEWLGFTCASCHTGEITYKNKTMRVEGGPSLANHMLFRTDLMAALQETKDTPAKYQRLANNVMAAEVPQMSQAQFDAAFNDYFAWYKDLFETGKETPEVPYGPGRLDAFSLEIIQFVVGGLGGIKENYHAPEAPISYPPVWDATDLDWVQTNGITKIPLERNIGEAIGVFGRINLQPSKGPLFDNNINFDGLYTLEKTLQSMRSPEWREDFLGALDQTKVAAGRNLFVGNCLSCHNDVTDRTPKNKLGKDFIKIKMIPVAEIGTDPIFLQSLLGWTVKTGPLEGLVIGKDANGADIKLGAREPAAKILKTSILGIEKRFFDAVNPGEDRINELRNFVEEKSPVAPNLNAYKARPLNGIWSSPPFLHNGSVPNLVELLKPAKDRMERFYVGSTEFDPITVGYVTEQSTTNYFLFDTKRKSNSNAGHEYGVTLQPQEKEALIEYLKSI